MQFQLLFQLPEWLIFLMVSFSSILIFDLFFRKGLFTAKNNRDIANKASDLLPNSLMMLLALFFGFSLSMSISRFDNRKTLVLREANAIGTTYLRADFFSETAAANIKSLLKKYLDHRAQYYTFQSDYEKVRAYSAKTEELHTEIWSASVVAIKTDWQPSYLSYINSLNEMIDLDAERRHHSLTDHVPEPVYYIIILLIFISLGALGYVHGCRGNRRYTGVLLSILFSLVLTIIMDLDRPRRGFIRVPEDSILRLQESLSK